METLKKLREPIIVIEKKWLQHISLHLNLYTSHPQTNVKINTSFDLYIHGSEVHNRFTAGSIYSRKRGERKHFSIALLP